MKLTHMIAAPFVKMINLALSWIDFPSAHGYYNMGRILGAGGGPSEAGILVSPESALQSSVVWACKRAISETLASLPLSLMQDVNGNKRHATEKGLYRIIHDEPNSEMSDMEFRETLTGHLLDGNAYARVARRSGSGDVVGLTIMSPLATIPRRRPDKSLYYEFSEDGKPLELSPSEVLHLRGLGFDGVTGYSVIQLARNSIGLAQIQERYASQWFARGGRRPYYLEHPTKFKDNDFDKFREMWAKQYGNTENFHNPPILEGGLKYTELGFSPQDAQFLESRQFSVTEICRWYRISPHLVQDLSRATFANIEHLAIEFVQHTLMPWCVRWEKALNRTLLTDQEKKQGYYFKHNMNALLRGDFASRMAGFSTALQNGIMCPNEVRELEDMNPFDGGDDLHIQLNMQTLGDGTPTASQAASLQKLGTRGGTNGKGNL